MSEQHTQQYGAFTLRLALGVMFVAHAWLKIAVFTPSGTAGFLGSVGVPLPTLAAYATIAFELVGGLLLIAGAYTRLVSLIAIPVLLGTIIFVHGSAGWLFSNEGGGWEYPAFLAVASLAQVFLGSGAFAVKAPQIFRE